MNVFEEPCVTQPAMLIRATTDEKGRLRFDLRRSMSSASVPAPVEGDKVNLKILAVDRAHRWQLQWNSVATLGQPWAEKVSHRVALPAVSAKASSNRLVSIVGSRLVGSLDPVLTQAPVVGGVTRANSAGGSGDACGSATTTRAVAAGSGTCWDPCVVKKAWRWGKMSQLHSDKGIRSVFEFERGRETEMGVAIKYGGGGWQAVGSSTEAKSRAVGRGIALKGNANRRLVLARYRWFKWKYTLILGPGQRRTDREWRNQFWDYEKEFKYARSRPRGASWFENRDHAARIPKNQYIWRRTGSNRRFSAGVSLAGLSLKSQAGFSDISKMGFTAVGRCRAKTKIRWAFGDGIDFDKARVIYAFSFCT